jgi:polar amino acid transport system substrate-binding protein
MKKLLAFVLCAILALGTIAAISETSDLEQIKANLETNIPGKLTVATSPGFAPYEFYAIAEDGTPVLAGCDIALAKYIAEYLGLELEIIPMAFDGVLADVTSGNVDIAVSGITPTDKRKEVMDFSDVFYKGGQSFVTVQGKTDKFASLEAVNDSAFSIGAQNASIQQELANQYAPDATIVVLEKVPDIITELISGKLDGAFFDTPVAENYQKNYPELVLLFDVPYDANGFAIGVKKGSENLLKGVNLAIQQAVSDGSLDQFLVEATELAAGEKYEGLLENK